MALKSLHDFSPIGKIRVNQESGISSCFRRREAAERMEKRTCDVWQQPLPSHAVDEGRKALIHGLNGSIGTFALAYRNSHAAVPMRYCSSRELRSITRRRPAA